MKAIVHIGTEKTGTTSIQMFLFQNRKKLKAAGFHFLQCAGSTNNRALPAYFVAEDRFDDFYRDEGISTREAKGEHRKQFLLKFEHEIGHLPKNIHTVVISSEHFHSRLRSHEELDRVKEFFTSYFDDVKIVCYLREQASTCASYYSTGVKSGYSATFGEFFQRCIPGNYYFNYYDVLSNWERCFGFTSLDVSLFSRTSFLNNNLLDDFTSKLDSRLIGVLDREIDTENESLTPLGQAMARGLNLAFPVRTSRPELAKIRDKCKVNIYQKFRGTGRQPSLAIRQKIYQDFKESNEMLRERYFPHLDVVFAPPVEEPSPETRIDENIIEGLVSLLSDLRKYGKDVLHTEEYGPTIQNVLRGVLSVFDIEEESPEKEKEKEEVERKVVANSGGGKRGMNAIISRADLRLLFFAAGGFESRNPQMARDLLTLIRKIDPVGTQVDDRLEALKQKEQTSRQRKFSIAFTGLIEPSSPEEAQRQADAVAAWLTPLADCIDGASINVLKDTTTLRRDETGLSRKSSGSAAFIIVSADSEKTAYAIASSCPHLQHGATVIVSEVLQVGP